MLVVGLCGLSLYLRDPISSQRWFPIQSDFASARAEVPTLARGPAFEGLPSSAALPAAWQGSAAHGQPNRQHEAASDQGN